MPFARYWSRPGKPVEGMEGGADCCADAERVSNTTDASCVMKLNDFRRMFASEVKIAEASGADRNARYTYPFHSIGNSYFRKCFSECLDHCQGILRWAN